MITDRFIPLREARSIAGGKSNTTLWRWWNKGLFPAPVKIGPNSIGFRESEIKEWVANPQTWAKSHGRKVAA